MTALVAPLTKAGARKLTARIQDAAGELWALLAEARDREAWRVLGYDSWTAYVDAEFAISRGQAFRLLDQARVAGALEAAVGEPVPVSARQAAVLRHEPEKAAKRVGKAVAKGAEPAAAVAGEVDRVRSARTSKQEQREGGDPTGSPNQPRAGRAAATAGKVAEAPTAAPAAHKESRTPPGEGDPAPSAPPSPTGGAPATADGVRHMIAMVTTTGATTIAHCAEARAIAAAIDTLTAALKLKRPAPSNGSAARPLARREVQPIPKGKR